MFTASVFCINIESSQDTGYTHWKVWQRPMFVLGVSPDGIPLFSALCTIPREYALIVLFLCTYIRFLCTPTHMWNRLHYSPLFLRSGTAQKCALPRDGALKSQQSSAAHLLVFLSFEATLVKRALIQHIHVAVRYTMKNNLQRKQILRQRDIGQIRIFKSEILL